MTNIQTLIIAAALIIAGLLAGEYRAHAQNGQWMIAAGTNNAWKINTTNGEVIFCDYASRKCQPVP